jgi:hypothetical protein
MNEEDIRHDDLEFNPSLEPKKAKAWLNLLQESEDAFEKYNEHCDRIDKQYANLERLSNMARDKEFQMFWANCEVIKPSIYAKAPVPVVVPKFLDRRPVYQASAELMQRCCVVAFDLAGIDELMKLVRDDLALLDRGVAWCRYESAKSSYYDSEKVCIDFKNRRDFLHSIARNWREVTWVAAASYLTRSEARDRFYKYSGDAYQDAEYRIDKETQELGGTDRRERAKFWEIWSKGDRRVVWVAQGCEDILDEDDPHLDLREFFPCPKPAYGTVQRGSLVPVPDVMQYRDQLEELNLLTSRIHALSDALEAKGFYPAGGAEIADAVQAAIATKTPGRVLVPISNWAAFGGSKDVIIWMPIDQIADTITKCVALRQQIIQDIYQIMGLSDIMRGATDPNETLGAQQMKTEYGGTRIQDKQSELVRLARDLVEISSEIITEKFAKTTMIEMSQTQLPTQAMQKKQVTDIARQMQDQQSALAKMVQLPQAQQTLQRNPQAGQQAQQALQQAQQAGQEAINKILQKPNLDQVLDFLKNNRMKSFVLDIETDSTIMPDETAEKQARTEFVGVLSQLLPQLAQMIMAQPETASFCGEVLKFATAPFRAGRGLDGAIDELVELMKAKQGQPQAPDPATMQSQTAMQIEQMKLTYAKQKDDADRNVKVMEVQGKNQAQMASSQTDAQAKALEVQGRQQESAAKLQQIQVESAADAQEHQAKQQTEAMKMQFAAQKHDQTMQAAAAKATHFDQMAQDRRAQQQFKAMQPPQPRGPV